MMRRSMLARTSHLLALALLLAAATLPARAQDSPFPERPAADDTVRATSASGELGDYAQAYFALGALNAGLPEADVAPNLQTPQAAVEQFVRAARDADFAAAARVLNLNLYPESEQAARAPLLAEQLYYVIDRQIGFDWEALPDRADALSTGSASPNDPLAGKPRRSLRLGALSLGRRDAVIRLQRVRVGDAAPVWVFSPQTVENIEPMYREHGPGPVDRWVPAWAREQVLGQTALWAWLALGLFFFVAGLAAWSVARAVKQHDFDDGHEAAERLGERLAVPAALATCFGLVYVLAASLLALPKLVTLLLLIALILSVTWLAMRAIGYLIDHLTRTEIDDISELSSNERADQQRRLTMLSVGRRVLLLVLVLVAVGIIIAQFRSLQALGVSLLASAGVATVLLGVAAQPVLGNIIAGMQIALTKPARIGDSVLYEGNWGYVEDITYTYIQIQTWDQRRVIVPLRYFITHPFENWTITDAHLTKPIVLKLDYTADVDAIRSKFGEMLRASELWDEENEPTVQVIGVEDETMEVRALCSAKDPSKAWDLHCQLREKLMAYVRDLDGGAYLPKRRIELRERNGDDSDDA